MAEPRGELGYYKLPEFKPGASIPIMRPEMHTHLRYLLRELDVDPDGPEAATFIFAHTGKTWPATFEEGMDLLRRVIWKLNGRITARRRKLTHVAESS